MHLTLSMLEKLYSDFPELNRNANEELQRSISKLNQLRDNGTIKGKDYSWLQALLVYRSLAKTGPEIADKILDVLMHSQTSCYFSGAFTKDNPIRSFISFERASKNLIAQIYILMNQEGWLNLALPQETSYKTLEETLGFLSEGEFDSDDSEASVDNEVIEKRLLEYVFLLLSCEANQSGEVEQYDQSKAIVFSFLDIFKEKLDKNPNQNEVNRLWESVCDTYIASTAYPIPQYLLAFRKFLGFQERIIEDLKRDITYVCNEEEWRDLIIQISSSTSSLEYAEDSFVMNSLKSLERLEQFFSWRNIFLELMSAQSLEKDELIRRLQALENEISSIKDIFDDIRNLMAQLSEEIKHVKKASFKVQYLPLEQELRLLESDKLMPKNELMKSFTMLGNKILASEHFFDEDNDIAHRLLERVKYIKNVLITQFFPHQRSERRKSKANESHYLIDKHYGHDNKKLKQRAILNDHPTFIKVDASIGRNPYSSFAVGNATRKALLVQDAQGELKTIAEVTTNRHPSF